MQIFAFFSMVLKIWDMLGHVGTYSDVVPYDQMHSDALKCVRTCGVAFGCVHMQWMHFECVWKCLDTSGILRIFRIFWDDLVDDCVFFYLGGLFLYCFTLDRG